MMSVDKHQILETITAVSRIITLAFKPRGTKIAIRDHNVVLCECEPKSDSYYILGFKVQNFTQGLDRYRYGDSREDIYVLNHVICNFIEWYLIPNKYNDGELYKGLINMARYLCVSLQDLQKIYGHGNVVLTLQYYVLVLNAVIDDNFYPEMLYMISPSDRGKNAQDEPQNLMYSTMFDVDKFKHFWSRDELISLCSQFEKCFVMEGEPDKIVFKEGDERKIPENKIKEIKDNSDYSQLADMYDGHFVQSLDIASNEFDFLNLNANLPLPINSPQTLSLDGPITMSVGIPSPSPSITQNYNNHNQYNQHNQHNQHNQYNQHNKQPPAMNRRSKAVPRNQNNVIVQGHLVGITNILNMMDKRFTAMLTQSYKGVN